VLVIWECETDREEDIVRRCRLFFDASGLEVINSRSTIRYEYEYRLPRSVPVCRPMSLTERAGDDRNPMDLENLLHSQAAANGIDLLRGQPVELTCRGEKS